MKFTTEIEIALDITPEEIADLFAGMDETGQAAFFNRVSEITEEWSGNWVQQLQYISDDDSLTMGARSIMSSIGDYAYKVQL